ncbi:STM4012 family radical SAM protein [Paraflavitalea pollutisoli]|uniref:STM4012 family radical SAM protein n=1 Tax=Paraflavitalea pollutisoli TaxID=3034143 RepID=UPI0023EDAE26|nr:STM4012 family radical SAM protein [Paraflavitalea sp. H1-2-19X]
MVDSLFERVFDGYAYSYPHKHSYRALPPQSLASLWSAEQKDSLFLYVHLPFCEMRCGFCNLFTIANPKQDMVDVYLDTLAAEADMVNEVVGPAGFGQLAIGGGTPTFLTVPQLEKLFGIIRKLGCDPATIPASVEMSPATISREKLALLKEQGVDRVSMGVQSFVERELKAMGRPQKNQAVYAALELIQSFDFPVLNIDLIYGAYGQTLASWLHSVQEVIRLGIGEVFMYPLYVRPLTGINKLDQPVEDQRWPYYQAAKQLLLSAGYQQVSMRLFRKATSGKMGPVRSYVCQEDGMIGLGAGARSYTKQVHYSSEYAVGRQHIRSIIEKYIDHRDFGTIDYGIVLEPEEQERRYVIKSVLHGSGLDLSRFRTLYGKAAMAAYPLLQKLVGHQLAALEGSVLRLTSTGIDYSDAIGPALYSEPIRERINGFALQ